MKELKRDAAPLGMHGRGDRPVRLGLSSGGSVEVTDGLSPGALVIINGLADVVDGRPVVVAR